MSRTLARIGGSGAGGLFAAGDLFTLTSDGNPLKVDLDMLMLGSLQQNIPVGGSRETGFEVSADGDIDIPECFPVSIDNSNDQFGGFTDANGAILVARFRFLVRVSDVAISATPKLRYGASFGTITSVGTISGEAACSAIDDDYSGTNQYQEVDVTLPTGIKLWKPQLTISGTGALPYTVWAKVVYDLFVQS